MAKLHHSFTQQKKILMPEEDNCPICEESLYLNNEYTQRVGLLNEDNQCCGWACQHLMKHPILQELWAWI